ncbi:phosphotransferase enzyme family protein [Besnoitia besnoiti]|uniref:ethanolamine kinase n=1 Tax=Besnoitia besnoiti TaxID=94643 RepID=A0A2A9M3K0_BESBE|nr:phosphotransferase enzyme family protein [Besnoitia besnoiti]PFH32535.1 phosphotransferase enzyme family protein [Besnoitia besnoiti]
MRGSSPSPSSPCLCLEAPPAGAASVRPLGSWAEPAARNSCGNASPRSSSPLPCAQSFLAYEIARESHMTARAEKACCPSHRSLAPPPCASAPPAGACGSAPDDSYPERKKKSPRRGSYADNAPEAAARRCAGGGEDADSHLRAARDSGKPSARATNHYDGLRGAASPPPAGGDGVAAPAQSAELERETHGTKEDKKREKFAREIVARLAAQALGVEDSGVCGLVARAIDAGSTNRMVRVWNKEDPKRTCAVKFFGENTGKYISREKEMKLLRLLTANNVGKEILGTFEEAGGGLVESWLSGASLERHELLRESAKIAEEMARLHAIDVRHEFPARSVASEAAETPGPEPSADLGGCEGEKKEDGEGEEEETKKRDAKDSDLWKNLWKFFAICKEEQERARSAHAAVSDGQDTPQRTVFSPRILLFDLATIEGRLRQLQALAQEVRSPIVLCHGDLLAGNIIKTDEGKVCFIDFEYSGFMERGFDIANHFAEYSALECDFSQCPTEDQQEAFLRAYVSALRHFRRQKAAAAGSEAAAATGGCEAQTGGAEDRADVDAEVAALRREVKVFFPLSNILWGLWALIQAVHVQPREMNYWRFAFDRLAAAIAPPVPYMSV